VAVPYKYVPFAKPGYWEPNPTMPSASFYDEVVYKNTLARAHTPDTHICTHTQAYTHTYTHTHAQTHTHTHARTHTHTCTHIHTRTDARTHTARTHAHTLTHICKLLHTTHTHTQVTKFALTHFHLYAYLLTQHKHTKRDTTIYTLLISDHKLGKFTVLQRGCIKRAQKVGISRW